MKKIIIILLFMGGLTFATQAQTRSDRRQVAQHMRIAEGRMSGEITRGERRRLRLDQHHIRRMECRAKADGYYSRGERFRLEQRQDRAGRRIYWSKHNFPSRYDF